jgi:hypothetical protein
MVVRAGNGGCAPAPIAARTVFTTVPCGAPPGRPAAANQSRKADSVVSGSGRGEAMQKV